MFKLFFAEGWDEHFRKLDKAVQERIWKKIKQLETLPRARHLKHGLPFFVVESGQYRIGFEEKKSARTILFAGTHKQYERWYRSR